MRRFDADAGLAAAVVLVAAVYLWADSRLPSVKLGDPVGPRIFPALIGAGLIFSALLLLLERWRRTRRSRASATVPEHAGMPTQAHAGLLIAMVAWTAVYYASLETVGYLLATVVYLLALLTYFHRGRHKTNIAVALGFTLLFDLLFTYALGVPMPAGWLAL